MVSDSPVVQQLPHTQGPGSLPDRGVGWAAYPSGACSLQADETSAWLVALEVTTGGLSPSRRLTPVKETAAKALRRRPPSGSRPNLVFVLAQPALSLASPRLYAKRREIRPRPSASRELRVTPFIWLSDPPWDTTVVMGMGQGALQCILSRTGGPCQRC